MLNDFKIKDNTLEIYTDGSCIGKDTRYGGNSTVIIWGEPYTEKNQIIMSSEINSTNNREELKAFITGLKYINSIISDIDLDSIAIYTDSAYIMNCLRDKWYINWRKNNWKNSKKQPVKNKDLWEELLLYYIDKELCDKITINKVVGHSDNSGNILADNYATEASAKLAAEENLKK